MVSQGTTKQSVKFTFNHDIEGPVFVAGSFNGWNTEATPMKKNRKGQWTATVKLTPGEYQFRYFADGHWYTDYAAGGLAPNGAGEFNSLIRVEEKAPAAAAK